ncbi:hypothetical protein GF382_03415 [Candidatus Falkowbacteria bacterium]|nr:hypothetical protein [Candidatus Falkowbacteria bacterium]
MSKLSKLHHYIYSQRRKFMSSVSNILGFLSFKLYFFGALLTNILTWVFTFLFRNQLSQDLIILHFNVDFGVDLIGNADQIFFMPILGLVIIVVNFFLLFAFLKNERFKFIGHLLLASACLANLFILTALGPIYYINFR